jgi:hypothetical protein
MSRCLGKFLAPVLAHRRLSLAIGLLDALTQSLHQVDHLAGLTSRHYNRLGPGHFRFDNLQKRGLIPLLERCKIQGA